MELCGIPKVKVLSFALSISLEDQIVMTLLAQAMCQQYSQKVMLRVHTEQILALITVLEEFCTSSTWMLNKLSFNSLPFCSFFPSKFNPLIDENAPRRVMVGTVDLETAILTGFPITL